MWGAREPRRERLPMTAEAAGSINISFFNRQIDPPRRWQSSEWLCLVKGRHFLTLDSLRPPLFSVTWLQLYNAEKYVPILLFPSHTPTHTHAGINTEPSRNNTPLSGYCRFVHAGCFCLPVLLGLSAISAGAERTC